MNAVLNTQGNKKESFKSLHKNILHEYLPGDYQNIVASMIDWLSRCVCIRNSCILCFVFYLESHLDDELSGMMLSWESCDFHDLTCYSCHHRLCRVVDESMATFLRIPSLIHWKEKVSWEGEEEDWMKRRREDEFAAWPQSSSWWEREWLRLTHLRLQELKNNL